MYIGQFQKQPIGTARGTARAACRIKPHTGPDLRARRSRSGTILSRSEASFYGFGDPAFDGLVRSGPLCEQRIGTFFGRIEREIGEEGFLVGDRLSVVDMYLFVLVFCRWALRLERPATSFPCLRTFTERLVVTGAARRAMARKGLAPYGLKTGLG